MPDKVISAPFLRWAGGKTWLIKYLAQITDGQQFNNYHEPFLGGGAMFFALPHAHEVYLSDMNKELINTYLTIQRNPQRVINKLKKYENTVEFYYSIREKQSKGEITQAARFIYLNHTSFNGIYRVNQAGKYNVPYGHRKTLQLDTNRILSASCALQRAHIMHGDFTANLDAIQAGDLVFLDPPYTVSHNNNGFIEYNKNLFSLTDQHRLSTFIDAIKERQAFYILTNAAHDTIREIFEKDGDRLLTFKRNSLIGGKNSKRELIDEYVFTNIANGVHE